ncbi:hypothetical protein ACHAWF_002520 [Thalassiosira exigua]
MPTPTSASAATTTLAAARGTLLSIALRLASFLLSQLTVRFVSASALGKASIPLELLLSTALFVSREGFRLALTKEVGDGDGDDDDKDKDGDVRANDRRIANVAWLTVPAGALASAFAFRTHLRSCEAAARSSSVVYKVAGALYCLAAFVESLSKPLVVRCLRRMDVAIKAKGEGTALVAKSVGCFGCLRLTGSGWFKIFTKNWGLDAGEGVDASDFAVTAFGISQLVYATTFTAIVYRKGRSSPGGIQWPTRVEPSTENPYRRGRNLRATIKGTMARHFDLRAVRLALAFTLQGLFKHASPRPTRSASWRWPARTIRACTPSRPRTGGWRRGYSCSQSRRTRACASRAWGRRSHDDAPPRASREGAGKEPSSAQSSRTSNLRTPSLCEGSFTSDSSSPRSPPTTRRSCCARWREVDGDPTTKPARRFRHCERFLRVPFGCLSFSAFA